MTLTTIGIDPGITGAIAFFIDGRPFTVVDLPTMQRNKKGNAQTINGPALANLLEGRGIDMAYMELVKGLPRQGAGGASMGATSAFNFGRNFGALEQALASAHVPCVLVPPEVWKKRAGLLGADKEASRTAAIRLFPFIADDYLGRKKDVGRAEALLIGKFGHPPGAHITLENVKIAEAELTKELEGSRHE